METASTEHSILRPRRLWFWFVGGFLLVFVGMLLFVNMTTLHPSGQYAMRCSLWQYYVIDLCRLFGPTTLGPGSAGTSTLVVLLETGFFHLMFSAMGGSAAIVVGWYTYRLRK